MTNPLAVLDGFNHIICSNRVLYISSMGVRLFILLILVGLVCFHVAPILALPFPDARDDLSQPRDFTEVLLVSWYFIFQKMLFLYLVERSHACCLGFDEHLTAWINGESENVTLNFNTRHIRGRESLGYSNVW